MNWNYHIPSLLLILSLTVSAHAQWTRIPPNQFNALQALYTSTNGASWSDNINWDVITDPSHPNYGEIDISDPTTHPYGIEFKLGTMSITGIDLNSNNLNGSLPNGPITIWNRFGDLKSLDLGDNPSLSASLPSAGVAYSLRKLEYLDLSDCNFSGSIPQVFFEDMHFERLEILDLSGNQFTGNFTLNTSASPNSITRIDLSDNPGFGSGSTLTDDFFDMLGGSIEYIDFSNCGFVGVLPLGPMGAPHASLSELEVLDLSNNAFTGDLWSTYFEKFPTLEKMDLSANDLTGIIPTASPRYAFAGTIEYLDLSDNRLKYGLPIGIFRLDSIRYLDLSNNRLESGVFTTAFSVPLNSGESEELEYLDLSYNRLEKELPLEELAARCPDLETLRLNDNRLRAVSVPMNPPAPWSNMSTLSVQNNFFDFFDLAMINEHLPVLGALRTAHAALEYAPQHPQGLGGTRRRAPGKLVKLPAHAIMEPHNVGALTLHTKYAPNDYHWNSIDTLSGVSTLLCSQVHAIGSTVNTAGASTWTATASGSNLGVSAFIEDDGATKPRRGHMQFDNLSSAHELHYQAEVHNASFPLLTLKTKPKSLHVAGCTDEYGQPIRCQEVMVEFSSDASESYKDSLRNLVGATVQRSCMCETVELWELSDTMTVEANGGGTRSRSAFTRARPSVESASPNYDLDSGGAGSGSTPGYPTGNNTANPVLVAIIDTGMDYDHADLDAFIWKNPLEAPAGLNGVDDDGNCLVDDRVGYDFLNGDAMPEDENGHGTFVAGIIAGKSTPNIDPTVYPEISLMNLRYADNSGVGSAFDAACAIRYAADNGARVINASWGYAGEPSDVLKNAIAYAGQNCGALMVCSAGNESENNDNVPHYPSGFSLSNIISVAALDPTGEELANFSNYGAETVDIAAMGMNITSTIPAAGSTASYSASGVDGTSFATAQVSRAAAILFKDEPTASYRSVKDALLSTAITLNSSDSNSLSSKGRLDLSAARARLASNPYLSTCELVLDVKLNLGGALDTVSGLMQANLFDLGQLPSAQPFNTSPWFYAGSETMGGAMLTAVGNDRPVDWVLLGLSTEDAPKNIQWKAVLVQVDGNLVEADGTPILVNEDEAMYVHCVTRNHLGIRSNSSVVLDYHPVTVDFKTLNNGAIPSVGHTVLGGVRALAPGDAEGDGFINAVDKNEHWRLEHTNTGYLRADFNLDGKVDMADYTWWQRFNGGETPCTSCY